MPPEDDKKKDDKPDLSKEIEAMKTRNAELEAKIKELSAKPDDKKKDDKDDPELIDKAKKQRESDDLKASESKQLESALRFSLKSEDFLKINGPLLPKDVGDIFKQAESEKYKDAIQKDRAIKSGIVQSFFKVQANLDLLTPGLKTNLDEYLKLTKDGKEERAQHVYDNVFEPAFEMLKRMKKAEALSKGFGSEDDADTAYKNRMIALSKKHYLGEKTNGT